MGVLPVPDIVTQMSNKIDQLDASVKATNLKLDKVLDEIRRIRIHEEEVKAVTPKLESMKGSLDITRDQVAMLCAMIEKTV